jgi:acetate---CoA ligase (ADP-forming)
VQIVNSTLVLPRSSCTEPDTGELLTLRDGSQVTVRQADAHDEPALCSFLEGLCPEARRMRFFSVACDMRRAAHWAARADQRHYGLVARDGTGAIVGHAAYIQLDDTRAEVAVEVADDLHGRGLGTLLIERLAMAAQRRGITHFEAVVLAENRVMLDVFRKGFDGRVVARDGTDRRVEFLTSAWRLAQRRFHSNDAQESG